MRRVSLLLIRRTIDAAFCTPSFRRSVSSHRKTTRLISHCCQTSLSSKCNEANISAYNDGNCRRQFQRLQLSLVERHRQTQQHQQQRRSMMARSSAPSDETPFDKAFAFIVSIGYDTILAHDMVKALQDAGLNGEALLATARQMAGRWEVGEDAGLEALAATLKAERSQKEGRAMVKIWVVPPNAWESAEVDQNADVDADEDPFTHLGTADMTRAFPVTAVEGTTLTDVAKFGIGEGASTLGEYMECACSGIMACSTCHVVVEPDWFDKVGPPSEAEQDMLDLAYGPRETSRLGCQLVLTNDLDGLVIRLPAGANNIMDDIPFKD